MLGDYRITGRRASDIAASVEAGVGSGALAPGALLPPMRELAGVLGVNPNTVAAAYRTLRERGVIETDGRRGSRVRGRPASAPRDELRMAMPPGVRNMASGNPDVRLLPPLDRALAVAAERYAQAPTLYGDDPVVPELARLARAGFDADGVPDGPMAVTSGALDGIERVLSGHLRPGDAIAIEDPGWGSVLDLAAALGLRVVPVAVDDEGPVAAEVERALREGARALVVTSRAQNPTGAAVSAGRAAELRAVLTRHPEALVVEDDHGHGIVDVPLHALGGVTRHWALARSTAKAYGPDLRLAVLTGDAVTLDRVRGRQRLGPGWVSRLLQYAVVELWTGDAVDRAAVARSYGERRDGLVAALLERGVRAHGRTGMNVWVPVADETGVVTRLMASGWGVAPGRRFRVESGPGVRVTVSGLRIGEVAGLADALATAVRPVVGGRFD
ncbi:MULTISPECIES: aminotransferase class I/II-fold pyridoxal phosphate-dependent enzyme [unclassified Streptomyces]|uniref:aminotransferase class I/II-fold pyridoxal phosphate-dependent enzyme n=1 Tax=unclassified Streptomyces TaxID=2593676 RepID=UPI001BEB992C|nr:MULTISPECIES: aminotransferase class I/II-fold pyridoxal phosphate-dependent enzyme [unclassified Streptomyces]MBT2404765.1 aminotransferase class I/II-fold pyridoxal phosphate-dependent enzyme [Streptomyces sp. ISL-21]MBT2454995.1 aminotransferase class I/II-fold pyridoxal phosphate-dependent enzyme [Streptomyces sp. ISL-86]MBT2609082.1 aminotransferase class I/II-fold pyridoxal phosphate-dependent enzyme [Streptomyces sp. ISL-87]